MPTHAEQSKKAGAEGLCTALTMGPRGTCMVCGWRMFPPLETVPENDLPLAFRSTSPWDRKD